MDRLLSYLSTSPNAEKKDRANQLASDPIICMQPFGLTNFQSKLIAPMFTHAWRLHEHEARLMPPEWSKFPWYASRSLYEPPPSRIHEMPDCNVPSSVAAIFSFADNDPELAQAMLASTGNESLDKLAQATPYSSEAGKLYGQIPLEEILEFDGMIQKSAHTMVYRPVTFVASHQAGWIFERCLAIAFFGRECLFPCVAQMILSALCGDDETAERSFSLAYVSVFPPNTGTQEMSGDEARSALIDALKDGGLVDEKLWQLRACFVANLVQRPIIRLTRSTKAAEPNRLTFALPNKPPQDARRPIILCQDHIVALASGHPHFAEEPCRVLLELPDELQLRIFPTAPNVKLALEKQFTYDGPHRVVLNGGVKGMADPIALPNGVQCVSPIRGPGGHSSISAKLASARAAEDEAPQQEVVAAKDDDAPASPIKEKEKSGMSDDAALSIDDDSPTMDFGSFPATYFAMSHVHLDTHKPASTVSSSSSANAGPNNNAPSPNNSSSAQPVEGSAQRQQSSVVFDGSSKNVTPADRDSAIRDLLHSPGFGKDEFSDQYLSDVMLHVRHAAPMHVDADGHCLLHSISRLLVGKEYLWHALRTALWKYMRLNAPGLKAALKKNEMLTAICEEYDSFSRRADPKYTDPSQLITSARGLGNEHVFALANLLKRPIVLLDNPKIGNSERWVFLPLLHKPEECCTKRVLVIGWSAPSHHHFVPVMPKFDDAHITKEGIPMRLDDPNAVAVFACPTDANPNELFSQYVLVDADGSVPMGGECRMNLGHIAHYVTEEFRQMTQVSVWSLHELARRMVQGGIDSSQLCVIDDAEQFLSAAVEMVKKNPLYYCYGCTKTSGNRMCMTVGCPSDGRKLDVISGRFPLELYDSLPVRADSRVGCCGWKHFYTSLRRKINPIPQKGEYVYARDVCNSFAVAKIIGMEESRIKHGLILFHLEFLNGTRRYCTPDHDMLAGYPVDCNLHTRQIAVRGYPFEVRLCIDNDSRLMTNPVEHANDSLALVADRLRGAPQRDVDAIKEKLASLITTSLEGTKEALYQQFLRQEEKTAPMRPSSERPLVFHDKKDGTPVVWESEDPRSHEWIPYERVQTGTLEATFQSGESTAVIKIEGFGHFTCNFTSMTQENDQGGSRWIRRVCKTAWKCHQCTLENEPDCDYCAACASTRPTNARAVVRDRSTLAMERIEKSYTDDRLKKDGELYKAAGKFDIPRGSASVSFPGAYGKSLNFFYHTDMERYIPVKDKVVPGDPIYPILEARLNKATNRSKLLDDTIMQKHADGSYTEVKAPSNNNAFNYGYI